MWVKRSPRFQDTKDEMYQLPHNGAHNDLSILPVSLQTMIECLDDRITLDWYQCWHEKAFLNRAFPTLESVVCPLWSCPKLTPRARPMKATTFCTRSHVQKHMELRKNGGNSSLANSRIDLRRFLFIVRSGSLWCNRRFVVWVLRSVCPDKQYVLV